MRVSVAMPAPNACTGATFRLATRRKVCASTNSSVWKPSGNVARSWYAGRPPMSSVPMSSSRQPGSSELTSGSSKYDVCRAAAAGAPVVRSTRPGSFMYSQGAPSLPSAYSRPGRGSPTTQ